MVGGGGKLSLLSDIGENDHVFLKFPHELSLKNSGSMELITYNCKREINIFQRSVW